MNNLEQQNSVILEGKIITPFSTKVGKKSITCYFVLENENIYQSTKKKTTEIYCVAFNAMGKVIMKRFQEGDMISVKGSLYTNKDNGRTYLEIHNYKSIKNKGEEKMDSKIILKGKNLVKKIVTTCICVIALCTTAFADVSSDQITSGAKQMVDLGLTVLSAIPALFGLMGFYNAVMAYMEAQDGNGGGQAQAKMTSNIVKGVIGVVLCVLVNTVFKKIINSMFGF